MNTATMPTFLFADSQLLFFRDNGELVMDRVRELVLSDEPRAAYVGASNGDDHAFYSIFEAAMEGVGITRCRHVRAELRSEDEEFLKRANIIVLSGGDVARGLAVMRANGLAELIPRMYFEGAILIGISAGAVQLGLCDSTKQSPSISNSSETLKLVPLIVGVHDERNGWTNLRRVVGRHCERTRAIGIPTGGGLIYHTDQTLEPLRRAMVDFSIDNGRFATHLMVPREIEEMFEVGSVH